MFNSDTFKELYAYNLFANTQLLPQVMQSQAPQNAKTIKLMAHILNAQTIWNARMMRAQQAFGPWQEQDPKHFEETMHSAHQNSLYVIEHANLTDTLQYTNSLGNTYVNTFSEVLFHVINHSTYHRAQIASDLKQMGITPAVTDYIAYKR